MDTILSVQPKEGGGGGGETRESIVYQLADDMLRKLPPKYVSFEVREALNRLGALLPMNIFFRYAIHLSTHLHSIQLCEYFINFITQYANTYPQTPKARARSNAKSNLRSLRFFMQFKTCHRWNDSDEPEFACKSRCDVRCSYTGKMDEGQFERSNYEAVAK